MKNKIHVSIIYSLSLLNGQRVAKSGTDYETRGMMGLRGFIEGEGCDYLDMKELP